MNKTHFPLSMLAVSLSLILVGCNDDDHPAPVKPSIDGIGATLEAGGYMYFFEEGVPQSITTTASEELEVSSYHKRDSSNSLKWTFDSESKITFHQNIGYKFDKENDTLPQTFMAWIYNEKPINGQLTFEFGDDNSTATQFTYNLDFHGWRGISVPFHDMDGTPTENMNRLRVIAPNANGTVYFDQMMLSVPVDHRWPTGDHQQPHVNASIINTPSKNWTALLTYDNMLRDAHPTFTFDTNFSENGEAAKIYENFDLHLGVNKNLVVTPEKIDANIAAYDKFQIAKNPDGSISGVPLDFTARTKFMTPAVVSPETKKLLASNNMRELGKAIKTTAMYLMSDKLDAETRQRLEMQLVTAWEYALSQGMQYGSGMQVVSHIGYQTRELFDGLYLARNVLAKHGLLESAQGSMMWFNATGRIYEKDEEIIAGNIDIFNTQLQWMIKSVLLLPNEQERHEVLQQLSSWLSKTMLASDGVGGGFKPDGSLFHHNQHYPAYGKDGQAGAALAIYALGKTRYAITPEAHERIKMSLLNARFYTKQMNTPLSLSGRHPDGKQKMNAEPFKWLAKAGTPNGSASIDPDIAAAYANITGAAEFESVAAESEPVGSLVMNYASMGVVRGNDGSDADSWIALARGFSRYLVGNETYSANNLYGRYNNYGSLEIIPSNYANRAFSHDGWNWSRYSGTTTINLPNEKLRSVLHQLDGAGIEEMLLSTESYSGASKLDDKSAMFAIKLHGHKKYQQQGFTANKSYFIFGNEVIAMGSNINSLDSEYNTETTLFQHSVTGNKAVSVNSELINTIGKNEILEGEIKLVDAANNHYFIDTTAMDPVLFSYDIQHSNDEDDGKPTQGEFATAVINHGTEPVKAKYEYSIKIDAADDIKPVYSIIEHSENLHAVDKDGVEAFAFFKPTTVNNSDFIIEAKTASQVMVKSIDANTLSVSIMNPDLNLYQGIDQDQVDENGEQVEVSIYSREWAYTKAKPVTTTIILKGQWNITETNSVKVESVGANTQLTVTTLDAKPMILELTK